MSRLQPHLSPCRVTRTQGTIHSLSEARIVAGKGQQLLQQTATTRTKTGKR
jgi:hypothetical protein